MISNVRTVAYTQSAASQIFGARGQLVAALDSFLITGFNAKNVVNITKNNTKATIETQTNHGFSLNDLVGLTGANQENANIETKISNIINGNTLEIEVPDTFPALVTGSVVIKYPPVKHWTKTAFNAGQAIYKSTFEEGTGIMLHVNDTNARFAAVRMIKGFSTFNDGLIEPTPIVYWHKAQSAGTTPIPYIISGDHRRFHVFTAWPTVYTQQSQFVCSGYFFGDIESSRQTDSSGCALIGDVSSLDQNSSLGHYQNQTGYNAYAMGNGDTSSQWLFKSYHQLGSAVLFGKRCKGGWAYSGYNGLTFPNPSDNGVYLDDFFIDENGSIRGRFPGVYAPMEAIRKGLLTGDMITSDILGHERTMMYVRLGCGSDNVGGIFIDETGPWDKE